MADDMWELFGAPGGGDAAAPGAHAAGDAAARREAAAPPRGERACEHAHFASAAAVAGAGADGERGGWEAQLSEEIAAAASDAEDAVADRAEALDPWVATALRVAASAWDECRAERSLGQQRFGGIASAAPARDEAERAIRTAVERMAECGGTLPEGGVWARLFVAARGVVAGAALASGADDAARCALQLVDAALSLGGARARAHPGQARTHALAWVGALAREAAEAQPLDSGAAALPPVSPANARIPASPPSSDVPHIPPERAVPRKSCVGLSAARFADAHVRAREPVVLTDMLSPWLDDDLAREMSDLRWWSDPATCGNCLVPVEMGVSLRYGAAGGGANGAERIMRVAELARFMAQSNASSASDADDAPGGGADGNGGARPQDQRDQGSSGGEDDVEGGHARAKDDPPAGLQVAYMSQHRLLHHAPALRERFEVPPYALGRVGSMNVWLGTRGTVTPLHTDEAQNLLSQLAGAKYVRLYSPRARAAMYPFRSAGNEAANEYSEVRCESPDANRHPLFLAEEGFKEVVLLPGETLFIPKGWWHYVRALTTAASMNTWW